MQFLPHSLSLTFFPFSRFNVLSLPAGEWWAFFWMRLGGYQKNTLLHTHTLYSLFITHTHTHTFFSLYEQHIQTHIFAAVSKMRERRKEREREGVPFTSEPIILKFAFRSAANGPCSPLERWRAQKLLPAHALTRPQACRGGTPPCIARPQQVLTKNFELWRVVIIIIMISAAENPSLFVVFSQKMVTVVLRIGWIKL